MERIHLDCPHCGAQLPAQAPSGQVTCEYCGTGFQAAQAGGARTQAGEALDPDTLAAKIARELQSGAHAPAAAQTADRPPEPSPPSARRSSRAIRTTVLMTILVALVPAGVAMYSAGLFEDIPGLSNIPSAGELVDRATGEHLIYDTVGGPPQPVTIGGESAIVGRTRASHADDQLFVEAYDAATVDRHWRIGPLGSYGDAYRAAHFAAHDDYVFVTDPQPTLRVHDLESGEELETIALTDRVDTLCIPPVDSDHDSIWIEQVDERTSLLDLDALTLEEAGRPGWCPQSTENVLGIPTTSNAVDNARAPRVEGMRTTAAFVDDDLGVALGVRDPGTAIPLMAGFDPDSREIRYQHDVAADVDGQVRERSAQHAALRNERFFATYGSGSDAWHITAFDAETGARLWNTTLRPLFAVDSLDALVASDDHVYVMRTSSVEVFSADDGELLGTVGRETYD